MLRRLYPLVRTPVFLFAASIAWLVVKQVLAMVYMGLNPVGPISLATLGAVIFCSSWVRRTQGRRQMLGYVIVNAAATLLVYTDILYFRRFGDLVSVASLRFVGQVSAVTDTLVTLLRLSDLWLWVDIVLLLLLLLRGAPNYFEGLTPSRRRVPYLSAALGLLLVMGVMLFDPFLSAAEDPGPRMVARRMGMINYHALDAGAYLTRLTARLTPEQEALREVRDWFANRKMPTGGPLSHLQGAAAGRNAIVLQVESFHAFLLNREVNGQEITPNLNRLARESLLFTNFYSQTGQGVSSDADLLANCSLYPSRTGAVYYDFAKNDYRCMPTLLREAGYQAVAMQGIEPTFWNLEAVYPQVGFERYYSLPDFENDDMIGLGLSDQSFLRQAVGKIKKLPEPFYSFVVTLSSHTPFDYEQLPRTLNLGSLEGTRAGHYLHAAHYTDHAIGQFLDALAREGILDRSVLMLYGDHTGVWRHDPGVAELLGVSLDDEVTWTALERQVPFLFRFPGGEHAGEWDRVSSQVDMAPTLAALLGLAPEDTYFMGRNLLIEPEGMAALYTGSAVSDRYLYLETDEPEGMCYHQETGRPVASSLCKNLAVEAARDLRISRLMVERNLIPKLRLPPEPDGVAMVAQLHRWNR